MLAIRKRFALGVAVAAGMLACTPITGAAAATTAAPVLATVSYPVSFTVVDTDQSSLDKGLPNVQIPGGLLGAGSNLPIPVVPGDGKTYTVQGHITAPAGALKASNPAATLYVHGHGYGEWFWRFTSVAGYNYAQAAAQAGLVSVTIDKLGYGASSIVNGNDLGYGTEATIDHQILGDLRTGSYTMNGGAGVKFSKLALAGGTQAAFSAEQEEVSFHDIQGLILAGFSDEGFSPSLVTNYALNILSCQTDAATPGTKDGVPGYEYRETTTAKFNSDDLVDTAPAVVSAADALHSADPCGYPTYSVAETLVQNNLLDPTISNVPVLSVMGADDSEFIPTVATTYQNDVEFALNPDHTVDLVLNTGQDLTLGTSHTTVDADFTNWLCARDFGAGTNGSCTVGLAATTTTPKPTGADSTPLTGAVAPVQADTAATSTGSTASLAATGRDLWREIETALVLVLSGLVLIGAATFMVDDRRARQP